MTGDGSSFYLTNHGDAVKRLDRYTDTGQLLKRSPVSSMEGELTQPARLAIIGDELFVGWFATNLLFVYDMSDLSEVRTIDVEGFDDFIYGMSAADDGLFLMRSQEAGQGWRLGRFDPEDGSADGELELATDDPYVTLSGLWCE